MVMIRVKNWTMRAFWVKNPKRVEFWKMMARVNAEATPQGSIPTVRILQVVE